jgi:hydrocephalus-inducing protein
MNRTSFLEDEQVLHFEPLILQRKATVDVALVNPQPVPCLVDMIIKPKGKASNFPYDLSEKSVALEPNSSHKFQLGFTPGTCDTFIGFFEATVHGSSSENRLLKFTVEGVGCLPAITIPGGMEHGKGNSYQSNLGRTLLGFTKEKIVNLANEGVIAARVKLTQKPSQDFQIVNFDALQEIVIPPGKHQALTILFKPKKAAKDQLDITVTVQDNPKASLQLQFVGEGSSQDIVFEGLATDDGDLTFKDCIVGRQQQVVFQIKNVGCQDSRFQFSTQPNLTFQPRVGHLHAGRTKEIRATFFAEHQMKLTQIKLMCAISKIELTDPSAPDWDDSMKIVKWVTKEALRPELPSTPIPDKQPGGKGRRGPSPAAKKPMQPKPETPPPVEIISSSAETELIRVIDVKEEPLYTVIPGKNKELPMRASVVADFIHFSIDVTDIDFSPTMMYQTRVSECRLTNNSQIRFDYNWRVMKFVSLRTNYAQTRPSAFSVEPVSGFVEPGATTVFKVKFTPLEVDDFTAQLWCDIPFLASEPPVIQLSALSRRPLCHFNVELSDYISAGRRHPDYNYKLSDDIHVIELFSRGLGQKTIKRFELINPTASAYEITWKYIGEGPSPISCETTQGLISSGKRSNVLFGYVPVSVKTVESLWEFQIPEQSVRVQFLFVGRIMPQ